MTIGFIHLYLVHVLRKWFVILEKCLLTRLPAPDTPCQVHLVRGIYERVVRNPLVASHNLPGTNVSG